MYRLLSSLLLRLSLCGIGAGVAVADPIDFNREVRPILSDNCFQCHGPDAAQRKGDLRLDTEDGARMALLLGKPDESPLIQRIYHRDVEERMPPQDFPKLLTGSQKEILRDWIEQGAQWAKHWAFVAPVKAPLPEIVNESWIRHEMDNFVLKRLKDAGLAPSPEASNAALARRVSLDLTGLPPSSEDLAAFVEDDSPQAYDHLITRLFQSPRYGEHMAWQWLEAARYADTDGYQNDGPREMWRWRDWVIEAYNKNMPFDQFTIEQLAGDLLPNASLEQAIATGFNRNHRYNSESGLILEEFLLENAVDRVDTTSTIWMGLTAGCARCHDHKYDPLSQNEYYQLIAYFNSIPESGRAIKFGNSEPWIKAPTRDQQREWVELERRVGQAEIALEAAEDEIETAMEEWSAPNPTEAPLLAGALTVQETNALSEPKSIGKIPGLICNSRFSIAFHLTPKDVSEGAILSSESPGSERQGILVRLKDGHLRFHIITRWIAGVATLEVAQALSPNETVHVTLTNDGTQRAKGMRIYVNGKPVGTRVLHNTNSNKSTDNQGAVMRFGTSPHVAPYSGQIEDLRFYTKRTLTEFEAGLLAESKGAKATRHRFLEHGATGRLKELAMEQRAAEDALLGFEDGLPTTMVMEEPAEAKPTFVRDRGLYDALGERVNRGTPKVLPAMPEHLPNNRLGLAQWLVSGNHPLVARVTVNRYWQMLFGRGLVNTTEDFGAQASPPSHPKLLDWLAVDFMEHGWDVQHLLRQIVSSATYRQSSSISETHLQHDPDNRLLSRALRRRLRGNVLRDQALFVSGLLVESQGGSSVKPYQPAKLWREASNFSYTVGSEDDLYRRSLYTYWKRTLAPPAMAVLDTADREWCSVRPKKTNTPLQALTLLNETAFYEAARHLGERFLSQEGSLRERIAFVFQALTTRLPTASESEVLVSAYVTYRNAFAGDVTAARASLKVGQSVASKEVDPIELAAATALANVILNLDEVTTRE